MLIRCVKVGNIIRISHKGERIIGIVDTLPKIIPSDEELKLNTKKLLNR